MSPSYTASRPRRVPVADGVPVADAVGVVAGQVFGSFTAERALAEPPRKSMTTSFKVTTDPLRTVPRVFVSAAARCRSRRRRRKHRVAAATTTGTPRRSRVTHRGADPGELPAGAPASTRGARLGAAVRRGRTVLLPGASRACLRVERPGHRVPTDERHGKHRRHGSKVASAHADSGTHRLKDL